MELSSPVPVGSDMVFGVMVRGDMELGDLVYGAIMVSDGRSHYVSDSLCVIEEFGDLKPP